MKVRDLKKLFEEMSEEDLDLDVRVIADHGQVAMRQHTAGIEYIEEDIYMADLVWQEDSEEHLVEGDGPIGVKIFLIGD